MRFYQLVKEIRERKRNLYGPAFTQKACGSRMTPPITQEGWSRYENRDTEPNYDTVKQIAIALDIPDEVPEGSKEITKKEFFKSAGYDVEEDLKIPSVTMKDVDNILKENPGGGAYMAPNGSEFVAVPKEVLSDILSKLSRLEELANNKDK